MNPEPRYTTTFAVKRTCQHCHRKASTTKGHTWSAPSGKRIWFCGECATSVFRKQQGAQT